MTPLLVSDNAPDDVEPLVKYVSETYVNSTYRQVQPRAGNADVAVRVHRIPPPFPPAIWNVHDATMNNGPRTNNMCEGFNNRFLQLVGYKKPDIWKFIKSIQAEECAVRTVIQRDAIGERPKKRQRREYTQLQSRLHTLCKDVASAVKTRQEFLRGIAYNIRWAPVNRETRDFDEVPEQNNQ